MGDLIETDGKVVFFCFVLFFDLKLNIGLFVNATYKQIYLFIYFY